MVFSGVIEGFFGRPWGWPARLSYADFLAAAGYQFYIYAPKAEALLRRRWREPMDDALQYELDRLARHYRGLGLSFGVGLTPYEIYRQYDTVARDLLRAKVIEINSVPVDVLCILFDDMRGDIADLPLVQARVVDDVLQWSTASHFIVCPTYYSYDDRIVHEFGPPPKSYLRDLGRALDPRVDIFWTGERVISSQYSEAHLTEVTAAINRQPFIWDNSIANDARTRTHRLFLDPVTACWRLPSALVSGVAFNPMNQAHLSQIPLRCFRALCGDTGSTESGAVFAAACRDVCGASMAPRLLHDAALFQGQGLQQLDQGALADLISIYQSFDANDCAAEVLAWLRGEYTFDPQCLTD